MQLPKYKVGDEVLVNGREYVIKGVESHGAGSCGCCKSKPNKYFMYRVLGNYYINEDLIEGK